MIADPTRLEDDVVLLRPLEDTDAPHLWAVAKEAEIWRYMRAGLIDSLEKMEAWVSAAREGFRRGSDYPLVTVEKASGRVAGSTRYMTIEPANRSLEIGGTWLGAEFRRSKVNTHAKYLMLKHAFEGVGCVRVQFRTDARNERSQRAIERLGAVKEGIFRRDFIYPDGYQRNTIFYSLIAEEWPLARRRLEDKL